MSRSYAAIITNTSAMVSLRSSVEKSSSSSSSRAAMISDRHAIHMVQHLIERCLLFGMDREECANCLQQTANVQPEVTRIVWDELEKSNMEFFAAYASGRLEFLHADNPLPPRSPPPPHHQQRGQQQHRCCWRDADSQKENRPITITVGSHYPQTVQPTTTITSIAVPHNRSPNVV